MRTSWRASSRSGSPRSTACSAWWTSGATRRCSSSSTTPGAGYGASFAAAAEVGLISSELARRVEGLGQLRNILVHRYTELDLVRFVAAVPRFRKDMHDYGDQVLAWVERRSAGSTEGS